MSKYKIFLVVIFLAVWVWAAVDPLYWDGWILENILIFIAAPIILLTGRYFQLSNVSYTLIALFLILHVIGSHYTYAEVPFGYTLQNMLGASRNMYDRLVHFSFGLLLAYPMREVFVRITKVKGFWGFYLPLDITLSFSAGYEIIEWITVEVVDPAAGLAFLGAQGDVWDAQKDMALAGGGALIAMLIILAINLKYNPMFFTEFKESFRLRKNDQPMGEETLSKWLENDTKQNPTNAV